MPGSPDPGEYPAVPAVPAVPAGLTRGRHRARPAPVAPPRPAPAHRRARPVPGQAAHRARPDGPGAGTGVAPRRALLAGLGFDRLTERQVINHVLGALSRGRGGWIATPNIDICQAAQRDPSLAELLGTASLVVPDGMPLLWAARLRGDQLPERVTGSSLIFSLSAAAARAGRSVYLLGGPPGVPELAAGRLRQRYPDLIVAGCYAPPWGFERSREGVLAVRRRLAAARPDIVFVGLGCPKQERLIAAVGPYLPTAWYLGCGGAIPLAAGTVRRAPRWMQQAGLEWLFRLLSEPRRLFHRYVVADLPFAVRLLAASAAERLRGR
jgi:N-acetylglucosaminyldiphosphoundecaprenol N-acetyl-beta-D-mannosaminyltransferase